MFKKFRQKNEKKRDDLVITHRRYRRRKWSYDYIIVSCIIFLTIAGLVMLASASSNLGKIRFDDSYYYLKHQLIWGFSLGLLGFLIGSKIYFRLYEKIAILMVLANIGLLALVFTPLGVQAGGAERWLQLGTVIFQPSELLKITLILYLAAWLSRRQYRLSSFTKGLLPFLLIVGVITFLLLKQPSTTSAAILLAVSLIIYFVSGIKTSYLISVGLLLSIVFGLVIYFTPYRWERIQTFLDPGKDQLSAGYQINQTLTAIGNGGLWGVGYGQSNTKIRYLPEPIGDSIFAVIAEELGFIGAAALIGVFLLLIVRIFIIALKTKDKFGQLALIGFGSLIALQVFINIAAISGVIPLTGSPLPFISYGGTSMIVFMTIGGIVNNIAKNG